ncbi:hypothetical protein [Capnocytophaga haemolytica]
MSAPKKSFADVIAQAGLIATGMKNNATEVAKRGADEAFVQKIVTTTEKVVQLNNEQEKLKASLKGKTEEYTKEMEELSKLLAEAKKVIKLSLPQTAWVQFGIEDKH